MLWIDKKNGLTILSYLFYLFANMLWIDKKNGLTILVDDIIF